jgi:hypothetical protein
LVGRKQGLDDAQRPLQLVKVQETVKLPYWDGTRREKKITSWYFSDMQKSGGFLL